MPILIVMGRFPCLASCLQYYIGKVNDEVAALIIFGGIESTPVAFLG